MGRQKGQLSNKEKERLDGIRDRLLNLNKTVEYSIRGLEKLTKVPRTTMRRFLLSDYNDVTRLKPETGMWKHVEPIARDMPSLSKDQIVVWHDDGRRPEVLRYKDMRVKGGYTKRVYGKVTK